MIVSGEPLLDTNEKLMRTTKELCFPFQEDIDWVVQTLGDAKKGSFKHFIYQKLTSQRIPCCLISNAFKIESFGEKDFSNILILHGQVYVGFLKMYNSIVRKDIFMSDQILSSMFVVYYLSKSINRPVRAEINRQTFIYLENGYKFKAFREVTKLFDQSFPRIKNIFRNAREYVKYYTLVSNVEMKDFIFVYLFYIVWSLILLVFVLLKHIRIKSQ